MRNSNSQSLRFFLSYWRFRRLSRGSRKRFELRWNDRYPCLADDTLTTDYDRHYVYHPAWAARILADTRPPVHIDISSTLNFCAIVSAFIPVRFFDYRPAELHLSGLECGKEDILRLSFEDQSVPSLSCMHVVEHVGLGRYGDPLDPEGDLKAMAELSRVLAPGGSLLFVTPVGKPRIQFNAHRIYSREQVISSFPDLRLEEFSLVPDSPSDGDLVPDPPYDLVGRQYYGCGCFWFRRCV